MCVYNAWFGLHIQIRRCSLSSFSQVVSVPVRRARWKHTARRHDNIVTRDAIKNGIFVETKKKENNNIIIIIINVLCARLQYCRQLIINVLARAAWTAIVCHTHFVYLVWCENRFACHLRPSALNGYCGQFTKLKFACDDYDVWARTLGQLGAYLLTFPHTSHSPRRIPCERLEHTGGLGVCCTKQSSGHTSIQLG